MGDPSKANDLLALLHDHEVPEVLIAKVHTLGLIQTKLFPGVFSEERHFVDRLMPAPSTRSRPKTPRMS